MKKNCILVFAVVFISLLFTNCGPAEDPGPFNVGTIPPQIIIKEAPIAQPVIKIVTINKKNSENEAVLNYEYKILTDTSRGRKVIGIDIK